MVVGGADTVVTPYALNPGVASTFPYLSTIAPSFEQYRFHRLSFEYIPRVPATAMGNVMLIPEYDPSDPPPGDEVSAASATGSAQFPVWTSGTVRFDPKSMDVPAPRKFVRTSPLVLGDLKTHDVGQLFVLTSAVSPIISGPQGVLWVDYDVELFAPQTTSSALSQRVQVGSQWTNSSNITVAAAAADTFIYPNNLTGGHLLPIRTSPTATYLGGLFMFDAYGIAYDPEIECFFVPKGVWRVQSKMNAFINAPVGGVTTNFNRIDYYDTDVFSLTPPWSPVLQNGLQLYSQGTAMYIDAGSDPRLDIAGDVVIFLKDEVTVPGIRYPVCPLRIRWNLNFSAAVNYLAYVNDWSVYFTPAGS